MNRLASDKYWLYVPPKYVRRYAEGSRVIPNDKVLFIVICNFLGRKKSIKNLIKNRRFNIFTITSYIRLARNEGKIEKSFISCSSVPLNVLVPIFCYLLNHTLSLFSIFNGRFIRNVRGQKACSIKWKSIAEHKLENNWNNFNGRTWVGETLRNCYSIHKGCEKWRDRWDF